MTPCLKGSIFLLMVKPVRRLLKQGHLPREKIEAELEPSDLPYLEEKIVPIAWYPVAAFERLAQVVIREYGGGRPDFLVEQGRIAARELTGGEIYGRFSSQALADPDRGGEMMVGLSKLLFNFSEWSLRREDDGVYVIDVRDAAEFPDALRWAGEGFIDFAAQALRGAPTCTTSERPEPDHVVFRVGPA